MVTKSKRSEKCKGCGVIRIVSIKCPDMTPCLNCGQGSEKAKDNIRKKGGKNVKDS